MELLAPIGHIDDFIGMPLSETVLEGCKVGGRVVEATVAFLDERRMPLQLWKIFKLRDDGAFTFLCDSSGFEGLNDRMKLRIIEAFSQREVELNSQTRI